MPLLAACSLLLLSGCMLTPVFQTTGTILTMVATLAGLAACGQGGPKSKQVPSNPPGSGGGSTGSAAEQPAVVNLSMLNGHSTLGTVLVGPAPYAYAGNAVAIADINGDGIRDLIVGVPYPLGQATAPGRVFIIFGGSGLGSLTSVTGLSAAGRGFAVTGSENVDSAGYAVLAADVNGDGRADLVIGAPGQNTSGPFSSVYGQTWVLFGHSGVHPDVTLGSAVSGSAGFRLVPTYGAAGAALSGLFGSSLATGDLNHDGIPDLIVGAPATAHESSGATDVNQATVLLGSTSALSGIDSAGVPANPAYHTGGLSAVNTAIVHGLASNYLAASLATADLNGDGIPDLLVSDVDGDGGNGAVYVIFGNSSGTFPASVSSLSASSSAGIGFVLYGGTPSGDTGAVVSNVGDVNGDGIDDVAILATNVTSGPEVFVVFGHHSTQSWPQVVSLSALPAGSGFGIVPPQTSSGTAVFPYAVVGGDVNGDGVNDLLLGSGNVTMVSGGSSTYAAGAVWVIFGSTGLNSVTEVATSSLSGPNGFTIVGPAAYAYVGVSLAVGDVNGDGIPDLVMGAPRYYSYPGRYQGQVYVVFGLSSGQAYPGSSGAGITFQGF